MCETPKISSVNPQQSAGDEETLVDRWITSCGLNKFGDPFHTTYPGGTPLFDEATFQITERMDYIRSKHPDCPWFAFLDVESSNANSAPLPEPEVEEEVADRERVDPRAKVVEEETRLDEVFFSEKQPISLLVPPNIQRNLSNASADSDGWSDGNKDEDDWSDIDECAETGIDLDVKTVADLEWQCVRCAAFNRQFQFSCVTCNEVKNPTIHCDICDVDVPFMCYETHIKAHESAGHQSKVGIAFSIVSILRNNTSGIPTVVCWDFALNFVKKFFKMAEKRDLKLIRPKIVYHWTPKKNIDLIVNGNLKVPDGRKVLHQTDTGYYGKGVYTSPNATYGQAYGHGCDKTIMCMAICGKQYKASYPQSFGKPLMEGYDMHVSNDRQNMEWVFFDNDQLLPVFILEPSKIKQVLPVIDKVNQELLTTYREIAYGKTQQLPEREVCQKKFQIVPKLPKWQRPKRKKQKTVHEQSKKIPKSKNAFDLLSSN